GVVRRVGARPGEGAEGGEGGDGRGQSGEPAGATASRRCRGRVAHAGGVGVLLHDEGSSLSRRSAPPARCTVVTRVRPCTGRGSGCGLAVPLSERKGAGRTGNITGLVRRAPMDRPRTVTGLVRRAPPDRPRTGVRDTGERRRDRPDGQG